jgi:two-component system, NtrC family, sensor kinase
MQLLLLVGGLIGLAFVPLFFAIDTYTRVGLHRTQVESATRLAEQVNTHVSESWPELDETGLVALLSAEVQGGAVRALYALDPELKILARAGAPSLMNFAPVQLAQSLSAPIELEVPKPEPSATEENETYHTLAVGHRSPRGAIVSLSQIPRRTPGHAALSKLMALYMGVSAVVVLLVSYLALTRWIVEPTILLARRAERVREGGRRLEALERAPAELVLLSQTLGQMTASLLAKEEALERKVAEIVQKSEELRTTQASLVRSERMASVGQLAAGLAHEIGNPISALMGILDLLLEGGLEPSEERDFLLRMRKETGRIHRVLKDLLAFARPRKPDLGKAEGDLTLAIRDVLALLSPQKRFSELTLSASVTEGLDPLPLSHEEIMQVLLNLLMNAADASSAGGTIVVLAERTENEVRLSVTDSGGGVPAHLQPQIFEPFFSTKDVGQGTGLGLSVTRGLVEASGGKLILDEAYTTGARFVASWPLAGAATQLGLGPRPV